MGWASYLEDKIKRLESSIHMARKVFNSRAALDEHQIRAGLKALADAEVILAEAYQHLELATSPELDAAHALLQEKRKVRSLENEVESREIERKRFEREAAERYAELVDAKREIKKLHGELKKNEKLVEKLTESNYGAAVDVFTSEGRIKKYKPGEA